MGVVSDPKLANVNILFIVSLTDWSRVFARPYFLQYRRMGFLGNLLSQLRLSRQSSFPEDGHSLEILNRCRHLGLPWVEPLPR
jgi:hypothetical protein